MSRRAAAEGEGNVSVELLGGTADLQQIRLYDSATGLTLLPLVLNERLTHSDEILSLQKFPEFIEYPRQRYDYIVVDLPPAAQVVDVRAIAPLVDSFIFVVQSIMCASEAGCEHMFRAASSSNAATLDPNQRRSGESGAMSIGKAESVMRSARSSAVAGPSVKPWWP
jgi:hypothetical protein